MAEKKEPAEIIVLEGGRLINSALFIRDQFNDRSDPRYNCEVAFPKGALAELFEKCLDFAEATWGAGAADEGTDLNIPIKDGDAMAAKREAEGKVGDAYKGMDVIRPHTIFNKHGEKGEGGIQVYAADGQTDIGIVNQSMIYNGCYVNVGVTLSAYQETKTDINSITLYLSAVQFDHDGERLVSQADHSKLFKKVGRAPASGEGGAAPSSGGRRRSA